MRMVFGEDIEKDHIFLKNEGRRHTVQWMNEDGFYGRYRERSELLFGK